MSALISVTNPGARGLTTGCSAPYAIPRRRSKPRAAPEPATRPSMEKQMSEIPSWHIVGDWFDNCSCAVACPCTFAQIPDNGFCESVLFWHIRHGHYGEVSLDGLSFVRVGRWEG